MLQILQARLQQYVNRELPDIQAGFRKGRGSRDQIAYICWIIEKAREFQKNIYFCFIDMQKPLTVWITINPNPDHDCSQFLTLNYEAREDLKNTPLDNPDMEMSRECMFLGSLSHHNKDLEQRTLKPLAHHSSRVLDKPCYSSILFRR